MPTDVTGRQIPNKVTVTLTGPQASALLMLVSHMEAGEPDDVSMTTAEYKTAIRAGDHLAKALYRGER